MLQVTNLGKSYGSQEVFTGVTFTVAPREKVGLVGRNGEGKTTLFRMIMGTEHQDSGEITTPRGYTIGYLSQTINFTEQTVIAEGACSLPFREDGLDESYRVREILHGLGFADAQIDSSPHVLSGGFQVRLMLAKALLSEPNLLLLDEPTNYLDIVSVRWLQQFLRDWRGELMIITHDRNFMDSISTHTLGIHRKRVRKVEGQTQKLYEQLAVEEEVYEKTRVNQQKAREHAERFITRFRAQASKAKAVQSRIKQLSKVEQLSELAAIDTLEFSFNAADFPGKTMFEVNDLTFSWPKPAQSDGRAVGTDADETNSQPLISHLTFTLGRRDRLAVIGPNGRGKSTLLNLLVGNLNPTGGKIWQSTNVQIAYFGQANIDRLRSDLTVEGEIMATHPQHNRKLARDICGAMMFEGDLALKPIKVLSGGERARVLMGKLLVQPANLLFLDEPTNHLDMHSIDALIEAIDQFPGSVVIVTHSELILDALATRLIVFDGGKVELFEGTYRDFLSRVGWQDERLYGGNRGGYGGLSRKEQRAKRAAVVAERAKMLAPLKKRIKDSEDRIIVLEQQLAKDEERLLLAVERGEGVNISTISSSIHQAKSEIDTLFRALEETTKESEQISATYDREIE